MKYIIFFFLLPCFAIAQSPEQQAAEILRNMAELKAAYIQLQAKADSIDAELVRIHQAQQFRADLQALLFEKPVKWYIQPVAAILPKKVFTIKNQNNQ
jgi:hypothetical protein